MAIIKEVESSEDFKVQLVTSHPDIYVYVTKHKSEAKNSDFIWFFGNSSPYVKVKFVTSSADLKVQFVNSKRHAGWKNLKHKLQNRIG